MSDVETRCRLVLILPEGEDLAARAAMLEGALKGGDVASVILPQYELDDGQFQKHAEALVPIVQQAGAAALVAGDTRVAGRAKADGIHVTGGLQELGEAVEKFTPKLIVGGGNATDRHRALEIGEVRPDYIFFGKIGGDIKPDAHPKNLALAEWWASMVEIPCIVLGGTDPQSALAVAEAGAEFVALDKAVFADPAQAPHVVAAVNALLDEKAPRFEE
ncbi:thiamine phosphate synthase [Shinella sp. NM-101]|uniref:thiamine phosphate synthase n=1 Tax=Shinella sp. NM-101 TaxID=2744455 RepID=UPI001F385CAA|nr:thiamine phosphate synthase [Shinella sp. NM-101]